MRYKILRSRIYNNLYFVAIQLHAHRNKAREILRLLDERRNAFSTVNRLPKEVLTSIFEALQENHVFNDPFPPATELELANWHWWMVVTRVCRHWRRIALSTPTLWKNVHAKHICRALDSDGEQYGGGRDYEMPISLIERSRPATLNLSCALNELEHGLHPTLTPEEPDGLYNSLRDNVHRLEGFYLSTASSLDQTLLDILDIPLPHLSSLQIRIEDDLIVSVVRQEETELPRLFGGGTSNLRRLSLWGYTSWPHNTFPRLTHLSLHEQLTTPTLDQFLNVLEALPRLEVLHLERSGPEIPSGTIILPRRQIHLPNFREARFLVSKPNPISMNMNIQHRMLECVIMPPRVEILFSLPHSDAKDLQRLLLDFPFCDNVTDIKIIPIDKGNPCAAVKLQETQLIIQTDPISLASYRPFFGAQFPNLSNIFFLNTFLSFHHAGKLDNFNNLLTITINGALYFQDVPPLIRLLKDQTCDDVPCPRLSRITIYAKDLGSYLFTSVESGTLSRELLKNPLKVVHREPNKKFEVLLIEREQKIELLNVRWTRRW
jgi:hypothetical protein